MEYAKSKIAETANLLDLAAEVEPFKKFASHLCARCSEPEQGVRIDMRGLEIAELLLLAALWGGSFLFMRIAAPVLGPVWLIEFRVLPQ